MPLAPKPKEPLDWRIIDGIGPFFRDVKIKRINWSKIPFAELPTDPEAFDTVFARIADDFETLCRQAALHGFTAVTLDDLAHLADHAWLEPDFRDTIVRYRKAFAQLFAIAERHGLRVLITSDVFTASEAIRQRIGTDRKKVHAFLIELLDRFFDDFPEVDGIVFRIGESDGHDVSDALRSELFLRSAKMGNHFLRDILPIFERWNKKLIFRTWTVGAYPVGDLMWHTTTLRKLLKNISSDALILSMKHGDSDFFRYLDMNPNIIESPVPTIVEFQAKREYEGAGEFPAFVGNEHARIRDQLLALPHVCGISVWCQTGGWLPFRRLTFLEPEGIWNEINTAVTVHLFTHPQSTPRDAVCAWTKKSKHSGNLEKLCELLENSEFIMNQLWYISAYAEKNLYFRRVRIPPLMWIYWDSIFINFPVKRIFKHLVNDQTRVLQETTISENLLDSMVNLAGPAKVPKPDLLFLRDTGIVLAAARRYYFTPFSDERVEEVKTAKRQYKENWPKGGVRNRFKVKVSFNHFSIGRRKLTVLFALAFRKSRRYRILDRLIFLHLLSFAYRIFHKRRQKLVPKFARKRAMGVDVIFK